jgi:hypothetical protein
MSADMPEGEIDCKAAARLLSDAQERELGVTERTRLRLHLAICQACRNVEQQYDFIRRAMRRLGQDDRSDR